MCDTKSYPTYAVTNLLQIFLIMDKKCISIKCELYDIVKCNFEALNIQTHAVGIIHVNILCLVSMQLLNAV